MSSTNDQKFFIKPGYQPRLNPQYFEDTSLETEGIVYQPEVYPLARALARILECNRIVDLGCGRAMKLLACHPEFNVIGVDIGSNIQFCRQHHPVGKWIEWDLGSPEPLPLGREELEPSIIVCADVIEHLLDPLPLVGHLRRFLESAPLAIISTPDRDLLQGLLHMGPPVNPSHVREWNLAEFVAFLRANGLRVDFAGLTSSNSFNGQKTTSLIIAGRPDRRLPLFLERFLSAGPGAITAAGEKLLVKTAPPLAYQVLPRTPGCVAPAPCFGGFPTNPPPQPGQRRRIGIVARRVAESPPSDDIGTAYTALAEMLATAGHDVTLLDLGPPSSDPAAWTEQFGPKGIRYVSLPALPFSLCAPRLMAVSYQAYQWLRGQDFEVIHFHEYQGGGYYSLLAKHQGLAFQNTLLCVGAQGPTAWRKHTQGVLWDGLEELEADFMERESVRLADVVISPSEQMLEWLQAQGWALPATCFVQPDIVPHPLTPESESLRRAWAAWHETCQAPSPTPTNLASATSAPRVSVCLCHYNRPTFLAQAIASLAAQDYSNFEVVLVDDGSDMPRAKAYLDQLTPEFAQRGWQLFRQGNRYLGAARNFAAQRAQGEYLLFMDDDNVAKPEELSTFVRVAQRTAADVLTTFMDLFSGDRAPEAGQLPRERYLFLGAAASVGAFANCFGDANMLVRRDVFLALGGFVEDRDYAHQDWELLARAVLQGFHIEVVPEALFHYRILPNSMVHATRLSANLSGSIRPYLQAVPVFLRQMVLVAQGLARRSGPPWQPPPPPKPPAPPEPPKPPEPPEPSAMNLKVKKVLSRKWRNSFRKRLATMQEWFAD